MSKGSPLDITAYSLLLYRREVEKRLRDLSYERTSIDSSSQLKHVKEKLIKEWNTENSRLQDLRKDILDVIQDINSTEEGATELQAQVYRIEELDATGPSSAVWTLSLRDIAHQAISLYKETVEAQLLAQHAQQKQVFRSPHKSSSSSPQESLVASTPAVQGSSQSSRLRPDISFIPKQASAPTL